jgi:hypothetical protein
LSSRSCQLKIHLVSSYPKIKDVSIKDIFINPASQKELFSICVFKILKFSPSAKEIFTKIKQKRKKMDCIFSKKKILKNI